VSDEDEVGHSGAALPAPAVSPARYDDDYFLRRCGGSERWRESGGSERDPLYEGSLDLAALRPGDALLDVGTGRGELLIAAIERGASRAIGVEYSEAAVALARTTLERCGADDRVEVVMADARGLPFEDESFDLVTMLDVVEHLTAAELPVALAEARRVLRRDGRIFIHTFPTKTLYDVTYRLQRAILPRRRRSWPADPRNEDEHAMHVGEQSYWSLRASLRAAGFSEVKVFAGAWVYVDFVPEQRARRLYHHLARVPWLRRLVVADLWATATRPAA
jgi:ubiquinone/menaquinone biosynthesis C-methylase UbiE